MLRLSHLPRAPSINVRHAAPGHANPYFLDRAHFIDAKHPAAKLSLRNLPAFVCPQFTIRAFPNAVLQEPIDFVPVNPLLATGLVRARTTTRPRQQWWSKLDTCQQRSEKEDRRWVNVDAMKRHIKFVAARQLAEARLAALAERGRQNVGLIFHTPKKTTSKSCVIRRRLRSKMTAAIDLVVSRSADAVGDPRPTQRPATSYPPLQLVSRPLEEPLILQDWTYLVVPNLAIYKTPLPNLVQDVRRALLSLSQQSKRLESSWSALQKSNQRPHKSRSATRTRTNRPLSPAKCAQGPDSSHDPTTHKSVSTCLYVNHPIILSNGVHK